MEVSIYAFKNQDYYKSWHVGWGLVNNAQLQ